MVRRLLVVTGCTAALVLLCGEPVAQDRQVYRYTDSDGRVVYSDRAPTSGAKDLTARRVNGNTIETSGLPIAVQQATERFPVTLYTFACGEPCDSAQALLNRRGVPFATVNVEDAVAAAAELLRSSFSVGLSAAVSVGILTESITVAVHSR